MKKVLAVIGLIAFGVAGRLLPHPPNATPISAVAYSGARYVGKRWAVIIPLAAMILSDVVIGFYDWRILISVYLSFGIIGYLGAVLRNRGVVMTVVAPAVFFLVTNAAVWLASPWYEKSLEGLLMSYTFGLPFLRNMFLGDLFFVSFVLLAPRIFSVLLHAARSDAARRLKTAAASVIVACIVMLFPLSVFAGTGAAVSYLAASPSPAAGDNPTAPPLILQDETASAASSAVTLEETPSVGAVLGAGAYFFDETLRYGSYGDAVTELHKILIADGHLLIKAPTGWFGPLTFAAVKKYQAAHDIPDTGLVGPLTRAALNSPVTLESPVDTDTPATLPEPEQSAPSTPLVATSTSPQISPIVTGGGGGGTAAPSQANKKPEIILKGESEMHIAEGEGFSDSGADASDAEDGDISAFVSVSGSVNTLMPGTYVLSYSVTDSGGASDTTVRKVIVDAPAPLAHDAQAPNYPLSPAGENANLAITSSKSADPKFTNVRIEPLNVYVGDTQTLTAVVTSSVPVASVTATMILDSQTVTIPLTKSAADPTGNTYQASWVVFDTHVATYKTTFTARNISGKENTTVLAWSDPCAGITQGVNSSLSANCAVSAVSGLDGGNLTIPQGVTLTLGSGAVWVWNPGTSVTVNGAIAVSGTASAKKGYLFYSGSTNDSANTVTAYYGPSATMSGYVRVGPLFVFDDLYDVLPGTKTSNTVTVRGIPDGSPVTLTDSGMGESNMLMSINGGTWSSTGTMNSGDTLAIKFTGSEYLTTYGVTATVGGSSSTFYVTTREEFCKFC